MGGGRQARMLPACVLPMCDEGGRSGHEQRQCCTRLGLVVIDKGKRGGGEKERRRVIVKDVGCRRGITSQNIALRQQGDTGRVSA